MQQFLQRLLSLTFFIISFSLSAQNSSHHVHVLGEMKNVMWKGQLGGIVNLDTIGNKQNLFGLGPVEYLRGEILILDGKSYKSTVTGDTNMIVEETFALKAPFFAYANIKEWEEVLLPDSVRTSLQVEQYLLQKNAGSTEPFFFKLKGVAEVAQIHVVNLPPGTRVSSPDEAHRGLVNYELQKEAVEVLGFFSTGHKTIFTHHDTFIHMHLISETRNKMGHVDALQFNGTPVQLFLPKP